MHYVLINRKQRFNKETVILNLKLIVCDVALISACSRYVLAWSLASPASQVPVASASGGWEAFTWYQCPWETGSKFQIPSRGLQFYSDGRTRGMQGRPVSLQAPGSFTRRWHQPQQEEGSTRPTGLQLRETRASLPPVCREHAGPSRSRRRSRSLAPSQCMLG